MHCFISKLTGSFLALGLLAGLPSALHAQDDSVQDLLTGTFPGVQVLSDDGAPGSAFSVRIRGLKSLRGDTQPLYILDGVMLNAPTVDADRTFWSDDQDYQALQSTLDHINPADVVDIQILKDAAATAIYGSLGGNGVVLITTRHGKSGTHSAQVSSSVIMNEKMRFSHRHHAMVSGGEKQGAYYLSAGYSSLNGLWKGSQLENVSVNAKYDQDFARDSRFGLGLNLGLRNNAMVMATSPLGSQSTVKASWKEMAGVGDPLETWLGAYDDNSRQYSVSPHLYFDAGLGAGFRIKLNAGFDFRNKTRYRWVGSALERAAAVKGQAGQANATSVRFNADAALAYGLHKGGHSLDVSLGGGYFGSFFREYIYEGQTFFSQDLRAPGISIAEKVAPYRHVVNNNLTAAVYASAEYNYGNRYFISGSIRTEKLYKFEDKLADGGYYPSVSAAWDVAKESFLSGQKVLSTLKFKAGLGKSGSQDVRPMGYAPLYSFGLEFDYDPTALTNYYDIRWRNQTWDKTAGIDLGFLEDRLLLSAQAYISHSKDDMSYYHHELKGPYELSASSKAAVDNRGIELSFIGKVIEKKDVQWTVSAQFAFNRNTVVQTGASGDHFGGTVGEWAGRPLTVNVNRVGEEVASFFGYKSQGAVGREHTLLTPAFQGQRQQIGDVKFIDISGDGNVTEEDQTVIGHPLPRYLAGFNTTLSVKHFTLDACLDGAFDYDVANLRKFTSDPAFDLKRAKGVDVFSSRLLEDASYVRLARLSLSYDYAFREGCWLDSIRFTLAAKNLLTLSKYTGSAPWVNGYGFDVSRLGVDNGAYPSFKSFLLGVTLSF